MQCLFIFSLLIFLRDATTSILSALRHLFICSLLIILHSATASMPSACLVTSLHIFSVGFLALCNCFYAFSLAHCLLTEQVLVLLSLLFFCCCVKLLILLFLSCGTCRYPSFLAICNLVLLSLLFSAVMLSHCFCFFSAAGLAGNLTTEQKAWY
jgi:hypothetical protein